MKPDPEIQPTFIIICIDGVGVQQGSLHIINVIESAPGLSTEVVYTLGGKVGSLQMVFIYLLLTAKIPIIMKPRITPSPFVCVQNSGKCWQQRLYNVCICCKVEEQIQLVHQ